MDAETEFRKLLLLMRRLILCLLFSLLFTSFFGLVTAAGPNKLVANEVEALKVIAKKLGYANWDFSQDPCSAVGNWSVGRAKYFESNVTCNCSINNDSTCHITKIALKSQNLSANIPPEFSEFRYLETLDLSRNLLRGSFPSQWATMRLAYLSVMGNRLSGPFPMVLTKITTLWHLSLEGNLFSGAIPSEIGQLVNMKKLHLTSNAFDGALPSSFSNLTQMTDMRLSDNNFSGKIPSFIQSWEHLVKLHIQGTSLEGPIPSTIYTLTKLVDLRISDLNGPRSPFPPLRGMPSIRILILRNCLLDGSIPADIGDMTTLKTLDLSYNYLTGDIPSSFEKLAKADYLYLTGNNISGQLTNWITTRNKNTDLSYNNLTWGDKSPGEGECNQENLNLVESFSYSSEKLRKAPPCLRRDFPCVESRKKYSLHINCGGQDTVVNGITYLPDPAIKGASLSYVGPNRDWALSSTGNFMDDDTDGDSYKVVNTSALPTLAGLPIQELYKTARVSPLSLTYYGLCLLNGDYSVKLHFAEIVFTNDSTFTSLGKRIFNVYIQGKLVLKDFNIAKDAGGVSRPTVKTFNVTVTNHTLKIRLYWAGKGTMGIPVRGTYGPLISAISVDPNFKLPGKSKKGMIVLIVGVVASALLLVLVVLFLTCKKGYLGGKLAKEKELEGLDLLTGLFTLRQIKAATKNFDPENKLGEGGFGSVYEGLLSDGTLIAVKQLSTKSKQGSREFVNEIGMISSLQHPNLVKLYGCCAEGNQLLLIYEYMENNCLSRALFGRKDGAAKLRLDWPTRLKICLGIARGLLYLHEESLVKIVHRDIKTSNVLLDKDMNAKISDFGLARLNEGDDTHISTRIAGTIGYMAPEYAMRGYLTSKADVYSFGVVVFELVSGKSNTNYRPKEEYVYLLDWAYVLQERGSLLELVDPDLRDNYSSEEALVTLKVALLCTNASPSLRPTMSQVISILEGRSSVEELSDPSSSAANPQMNDAMRSHFWQNASEALSLSAVSRLSDMQSTTISEGDGSIKLLKSDYSERST